MNILWHLPDLTLLATCFLVTCYGLDGGDAAGHELSNAVTGAILRSERLGLTFKGSPWVISPTYILLACNVEQIKAGNAKDHVLQRQDKLVLFCGLGKPLQDCCTI